MSDGKMLSQAEIDALLAASGTGDGEEAAGQEAPPEAGGGFPVEAEAGGDHLLDDGERDALGEIGNISMGSASTTLSELLRQKVVITSPRVTVVSQRKLFESFAVPYVVIQVEFKAGIDGFNVLVIKLKDAMIMANLMMGGEGEVLSEEISEIELSAASEAMNQMIGTASTSLSTMFGRTINISPPVTTVLERTEISEFRLSIQDEMVAVVSFDMKIGDLVDTEIMQVLSIDTAKKETALLWGNLMETPPPAEAGPAADPFPAEEAQEAGDAWLSKDLWPPEDGGGADLPILQEPAAEPWPAPTREMAPRAAASGYGQPFSPPEMSYPGLTPEEQKKLELLLEVPLKVSVVLGRTKRPIKEVLNLTPGAIVELSSLVDEPVEVLVNGTLVARGEVVVVNENFGVRITNIMSPEDRLRRLKGK